MRKQKPIFGLPGEGLPADDFLLDVPSLDGLDDFVRVVKDSELIKILFRNEPSN